MFYLISDSEGSEEELITGIYKSYGKTMWKYAYGWVNDCFGVLWQLNLLK
jgi:predicted 3-demethylubiquinone-9 3-methyltransferase (glyoxalase superfamily)